MTVTELRACTQDRTHVLRLCSSPDLTGGLHRKRPDGAEARRLQPLYGGRRGITMTYANRALNGPYRQYGFADGTAADQSKPCFEVNYLNDKL